MEVIDSGARTIATLLRARADAQPQAAVLSAPGRSSLSYGQLWQQVQGLAAALRALGVGPRSRVALVWPNGPEMASCFLGVAACAACAPLNPACTEAEFRYFIDDMQPQVLVLRADQHKPLRALADAMGLPVLELATDAAAPAGWLRIPGAAEPPTFAEADAVALLLHTSGTTARPKLVPLTQANLLASAHGIAAHLGLSPADRCLNVMPLFHIHGLVGALLSSMAAGASVACLPGFDEATFFPAIAELQPTWYTAVPTIHQAVVAQGARYREAAPNHRFRFVRSSSSALPPRLFQALHALVDAPVVEAYGMTEASHQMASNPLPPGQAKPGSVGLPAGAGIALLDAEGRVLAADATGEIAVRGPGVTAGYLDNPEANARSFTEGWFRTGDQGRFDADGYLYIVGRLKEIVNRGGEKVSPREVDEALLDHPAVAQAAAFAVPHPSLGEDLAAVVVLRAGAAADEAGLRGFLFGRLADFKVPSRVVVTDAIPKGPTGKVQRTSLHERLAALLAQPFEAPGSETEAALATLVTAVLGVDRVGRHDNFFALGGDSLKGAQLMARLNQKFLVDLPVATLFQQPSVAALAARVDAAAAVAAQQDADLAERIAHMSDDEVERLLREQDGASR